MSFDLDDFFSQSAEDRVKPTPEEQFGGVPPVVEEDVDLSFGEQIGDVAAAPFRGALGAMESILELGNLVPGIDYDIPDYFGLMGESETFVGGLTEGIFQFALPFLAPGVGGAALASKAGKLIGAARPVSKSIYSLAQGGKLKSANALRFGRRLAKDTFGGAIADFAAFDPSEGRLSDLLVQAPALTNPVTEFLASDENDSEAMGRIKNVLEGAGLGAMFDTLVSGLRFTRTARKAFSKTKDVDRAFAIAQEEAEFFQVKDVQDAFNLEPKEANVVNGLISAMGLDRTRITIGHTPYTGGFPQSEGLPVFFQEPGGVLPFDTTEVLDATLRDGGSTRMVKDGHAPDSGYLVSIPGLGTEIDVNKLSAADIQKYAATRGLLPQTSAFGTWVADGTAHLDVNEVENNLATALKMAGVFDERAVYGAGLQAEIPNLRHMDNGLDQGVEEPMPYLLHFSQHDLSKNKHGISRTFAGSGAANRGDGLRFKDEDSKFLFFYHPRSNAEKIVMDQAQFVHVVRNDFTLARTSRPRRLSDGSLVGPGDRVTPEMQVIERFLHENPGVRSGQDGYADLMLAAKMLGFDGLTGMHMGGDSTTRMLSLGRDVGQDQIVESIPRAEWEKWGIGSKGELPDAKTLVDRNGYPWAETRKKIAAKNSGTVGQVTEVKDVRGREHWEAFNQMEGAFRPKGVTVFDAEGRAFINGLESPDVSTAIHEVFHVARRQVLDPSVPAKFRGGITLDDISTLRSWAEADIGTSDFEERLAYGFEAYAREGTSDSAKVGRVFDKISRYIRKVYRSAETAKNPAMQMKPSAEVKAVFDKLVTRTSKAALAPIPKSILSKQGGSSLGLGDAKDALFQGAGRTDPPSGKPFSVDPSDVKATASGKPPEAFLNRIRLTGDEDAAVAADWLQQKMLAEGSIEDSAKYTHEELLGRVKEMIEDPEMGAVIDVSGQGKLLVDWNYLATVNGESALRDIHHDLQMMRGVNQALTDEMFAIAQQGKGASLQDAFAYATMRSNAVKVSEAVERTSAEAGRLLQGHNITPDTTINAHFIDPDLLEDDDAMKAFLSEIGSGDWERGLSKVRAEMEVFAAAPSHQRTKLMRRDPIGFFQMIQEYWMNSILSGPITATVNALSGAVMTVIKPMEKFIGNIATGRWKEARTDLSRYVWMFQQIQDSIRMGARAYREGNILDPGGRVLEGPQQRALSKEGIMDVTKKATFGKFQPGEANVFVRMGGFTGGVVNTPSRFLQATDEFIKQLNYRAEVKSKLTVRAWELGITDPLEAKNYVDTNFDKMVSDGQRYSKTVARDRVLKRAAQQEFNSTTERQAWIRSEFSKEWDANGPALAKMADEALALPREATFTTPLMKNRKPLVQVAGMWAKATETVPVLRFLTPFTRTPTNLVAAAFTRNPLYAGSELLMAGKAKLMGELTSKDAAKAADAAGRFATGLGLTAFAFAAVQNGRMSGGGPRDRNQRKILEASGWQPYSVKVGDKWVSFQRMDPFSTVVGLWADMYEGMAHADQSMDSEAMDLVNASLLSVSRNITNKSYLNGLMQFFNALSDERMGGTGEAVELATRSLLASFVPTASYQASITDDPVLRETRNLTDAYLKRIYGMSDTLPPRRDLLGEPMMRKEAVGPDWLSPFAYSEVSDDAVKAEFARLGHGFQAPRPERNGVDLREFTNEAGQDAYDRWLELHGSTRIGGVTLRTAMKRLINSHSYQLLSNSPTDAMEDPQVLRVNRVLSRYRSRALKQVYREFPELGSAATHFRVAERALRSGRSVDNILRLLER